VESLPELDVPGADVRASGVRNRPEAAPAKGTSSRDQLLAKILGVAVDLMDADHGAIYLYDPAKDQLYASHSQLLGERELRFDLGSGLIGACFGSGEIVAVADAYEDPRFDRWLDRQLGYRTRSALCAPIFGGHGECVGVLELLNKRHGLFTADDERHIVDLAAQMAAAIDSAQFSEQVVTIESYMLRSLTNGVITLGLDGTVSYLNPAACRILHLDAKTSVGLPLAELFDGFNAWIIEAVDEAHASGEEKALPNSEFFISSEDDWVAANLTIVPLRDARKSDLGTMLVLEDIQRERELRRTMSRYMSNEVIDRLLINPEGVLGGYASEVTILFSDIRGFTSLTERLGASDTVSMLNEYFSFMEDVVTNRSGTIDKYIGDAIMALFGAPFSSVNDAANAVQAAVDMFQVLQFLNGRRAAEGKAAIRIGVGIGTGTVITGNIGSPKRMDFTVIGDPINLASRIESTNKVYGTEILVCGETWSRLAKPPRARRIDTVHVRGQTKPTELWEILAHRPDISYAAIEIYEAGFEAYTAGRWQEALAQFEKAVSVRADDRPAALMAERCRHFLAAPPENWQGVVDLK
jgi:adenylate cyclase